jgi:hypothetical protein
MRERARRGRDSPRSKLAPRSGEAAQHFPHRWVPTHTHFLRLFRRDLRLFMQFAPAIALCFNIAILCDRCSYTSLARFGHPWHLPCNMAPRVFSGVFMAAASSELRTETLDLELIAQRILKLAEIATLEHLESLLQSQAQGMLNLVRNVERA